MQTKPDYERLGGVYLNGTRFHGFLKQNIESALPEHGIFVILADPKKLYDLWQQHNCEGAVGASPGPVSEWHPEDRNEHVLRFVQGPRKPVQIPFISYPDKQVNVGLGQAALQMLIDWGARTIPIAVRVREVLRAHEDLGDNVYQPITGRDYLRESRKIRTAFEDRQPIAAIYEPHLERIRQTPELLEEMQQGIADYARLIYFQLEIMLIRHVLMKNGNLVFSQEREMMGLNEIRRLLHQQACVGAWLNKASDIDNLPTWDPADQVSEQTARTFLEENISKYYRQGSMLRMQVSVPSEDYEQPVRTTERRVGHLRVVRPEGPVS